MPNSESRPDSPPDAPRPRAFSSRGLVPAAAIILLALTLNLTGNGRISLWDRDEPRYAGCAREMRASGDYLHPTFNAEPRYHKPILIYWLMQIGLTLFGDNPYGARLVSAVAGAATCVVVWALGRRLFGPRVGLLAGLVLATAPIVCAESKLATTDAFLMFCLTVGQFALWELSRGSSRAWAATFWVSLALATLTKGPVGIALILAAAAATALAGGSIAWRKHLAWRWGIPLFILITAPWYVAIGFLSGGEFYRVAMGFHVFRRMVHPLETHGGWPGYYVTLALPCFYPWSALLPVGLLAAWQRRRQCPQLGFLLGWSLGPLILLELLRTKLIHYALPIFPGCALLVAWLIVIVSDSELNLRRWTLGRLALGLFTGQGIAMTVLLLAGMAASSAWSLRWPCLVMAAFVAGGTLYALERFQAGATERAAFALAAIWGTVLLLGVGWLLPELEPYRLPTQVARRLTEQAQAEQAQPMLAHYKPPSVIYYARRPLPGFAGLDDLARRVRSDRPVVVALTAEELKAYRADPRLAVETRGTLEGLDAERARKIALQVVLVRPGPDTTSSTVPMARTGFEEASIK